MKNNNSGERIEQFRNHFGLSQGDFSTEIGMSQANVSKIESGKVEVSNSILNAMKARFAANPEWIKTGQGEMMISPEEYLSQGIKLLGVKKFNEGLEKIFSDPQFSELQSYIMINNIIQENLNEELKIYIKHTIELWSQRNAKTKTWLLVQLQKAFTEFVEKISNEE